MCLHCDSRPAAGWVACAPVPSSRRGDACLAPRGRRGTMSDATGDAGQPHGAAIEDYLDELRTFPPPEGFARTAVVSDTTMFQHAAADPEGFWAEQARALTWFETWEQVLDWQ